MIYLTYQFNKVTYTVCDDVAQWDTNQVMKISNLPHYCTYNLSYSKNGNIITTETYLIEDSLIPFPNECFFEAGTIHCYIQREQDGETETIADIIINVKERSIPSNTRSYDVRAGKLFVSSDGVKEGTMPEYDGDTSVIPSKEAIVLKTRNQFIKDNITIDPIPEKYIEPNGTKIITDNGLYNIAEFENVDVNVDTVPLLQEKTITPTKSSQTVTVDKGFDGLSAVNINPIPDEYVIQNLQEKTIIPTKSAQDVTADEDYTGLSSVHVEPIPDEYIKPEGSVDITENGTFDVTEKAEVNVQVVAKPEKPYIDSSKITNFSNFFNYHTLEFLPYIETKNGVNFFNFAISNKDITEITGLNFSKAENFAYACMNATALKAFICDNAKQVSNTNSMFRSCTALTKVKLPTSDKLSVTQDMFWSCYNLVELYMPVILADTQTFYGCSKLENLYVEKIIFKKDLNLASCSKLTVESLLNVFNALPDNTGLATTYTVYLGTANLAKLTDEQKMIAYNKNIALG